MNPEKAPEMGSTTTAVPLISSTWEPLRVSHLKPTLTLQDLQLAARKDLYHKCIIFIREDIKMEDILDAMIATCDPEVVLPIMYRIEKPNKLTFLAKFGIPVLERLVKLGMRLKILDGRTLDMDIVLGFVGINNIRIHPQRVLSHVLVLRWENVKKVLNLDNFQADRALTTIYCPISSPRVFHMVIRRCVMTMARDNKLAVRELRLRGNGITGIVPFEKFFNYHLTKIDLRNNKIDDINNLRYFNDFKVLELWLDGNPLCTRYTTTEDYIRSVKNVFPHLQRLDGVLIGVEQKYIPVVLPNYLSDASRLSLVKQFIRHFFTFYDQDDRIVLNGLYNKDAFFSTTLGPITNTNHSQMTKAFATNRNLLKFVDYAKCHEFLLRGPEKIIAALRRQPPTHHDYRNFNIDIMHYGNEHLVLAVQGFFCYKEFPLAPLFFNRTLVIIRGEDNEYSIVNDQYHIQSETPGMKGPDSGDATLGTMPVTKIEPNVFSPSEKDELLRFLRGRTTMNLEYCRRYLENSKWNIRAALSSFTKAYTVNDVPPEAFSETIYS